MHRPIISNRMTSVDAILVLSLKLLLLLGFCMGKAQMETNNGTETSVSMGDFSTFSTLNPGQSLNSSVTGTPDATTPVGSTTKADQTDFSTTQNVPSSTAANELSSTQVPLSSTTVESSNTQFPLTTITLPDTQFPPSSATTKLSDTQVPPSSTTAELSSTQVASSSQVVPGLLETTADLSQTTSELPRTQVTTNPTAAPTTAASSLHTRDNTPSENASGVPLNSDNVTDKALKTDKITEADLSPMTTPSNEHYDVEATTFISMDNATDSFSNDTNNNTSSDDSDPLGNEMTSLMTQPSDDFTTMQLSTDMDSTQAPQFSSSSISASYSSSTSSSFSSSSSSQPSLSSSDRDGLPQPQPQEMTFAAKVALVFGVMVGISCVIVVAIVSARQVLGYWARRDYSNLSQDSMPFS